MPRCRLAPGAFLALFLWLLALLNGCASLPLDYPRPPSYALDRPESTPMGRKVQEAVAQHHGDSGFYLLSSGYDAFLARVRLINHAEKTLDLQYYIFATDLTGDFLLDRLLAAAERGVRVRLLLDDWKLTGKFDWRLAMIQANPNIQVRVFNPFQGFRQFYLSRPFQYAFGAKRLQGRMHNKAFIADNSVAIVGGRNIADPYFGAGADLDFGDLDIMAVGPVTRQISSIFDEYWNSPLAIPIGAFVSQQPSALEVEESRRRLAANRETVRYSEYVGRVREGELMKQMEAGKIPYIWAKAKVLADAPLKSVIPDGQSQSEWMGPKLKAIVSEAQSEVLLISPYLVPGQSGMEWFRQMRDRGITLKILTNSFASNDVPIAQAGYARYRKALLRLGVDLYELRPNPHQQRYWSRISLGGSSRGSLHAKTIIVDRQIVCVGSFNLDPRSTLLDTQEGLVIRSPELAAQTAQLFAEGASLEHAYRVSLAGGAPSEEGLVWTSLENGRLVRYYREPNARPWQRLWVHFLYLFVPESML